jgi:hypothetical protein
MAAVAYSLLINRFEICHRRSIPKLMKNFSEKLSENMHKGIDKTKKSDTIIINTGADVMLTAPGKTWR